MAEFKKDPSEIGCLWAKDGRKGRFLTGTINGQDVICFPVNSSNIKAPAWRVLKSIPQGERQAKPAPVDDDSIDF